MDCNKCPQSDVMGLCHWPDNHGPKPCEVTERPPLGLIPHRIWVCKRIVEILDALKRYGEEKKPAPVEWTDELWSLVDEMLGGGILLDED